MQSQTTRTAQNLNDGIDRNSDAYKLGICEAENRKLRQAVVSAKAALLNRGYANNEALCRVAMRNIDAALKE